MDGILCKVQHPKWLKLPNYPLYSWVLIYVFRKILPSFISCMKNNNKIFRLNKTLLYLNKQYFKYLLIFMEKYLAKT